MKVHRLLSIFYAIYVFAGISLIAGPQPVPASATQKSANGQLINLNTASEKELDVLPGVGPATAKKIVSGRPYSSVDDLAKAGVPAKTIEKIRSMVTVGARSGAVTPPRQGAASRPTDTAAQSSAPPQPGMVWVNKETKVFHRAGDRWYGKTKKGQYMTEADAVKAGYRESKEH